MNPQPTDAAVQLWLLELMVRSPREAVQVCNLGYDLLRAYTLDLEAPRVYPRHRQRILEAYQEAHRK